MRFALSFPRVLLPVLLLVLLASAAAQEVTVRTRYGHAPANADLVAYRDGPGPWRRLQGDLGRYAFEARSGRYALAVLCFADPGPHLTIYRFPVAELPRVRHACEGANDLLATRVRVHGRVEGAAASARPPSHLVQVALGRQYLVHGALREDDPRFDVAVVARERADVVALRVPIGEPPDRAVLRRDLDLTTATRVDVDFAGDEAVRLERFELGLREADATTVMRIARLHTCNGTVASLDAPAPPGGGPVDFAALPAASRAPCDRYELAAMAPRPGQDDLRVTLRFAAEPGDTRLALPPRAVAPAFEVLSRNPLRLRARWEPRADATMILGTIATDAVRWSFYQSASLPATFTLPDLRGVPGWSRALEVSTPAATWGFGVLRADVGAHEALRAWERSATLGLGRFGSMVEDGLIMDVGLTGGRLEPQRPRDR